MRERRHEARLDATPRVDQHGRRCGPAVARWDSAAPPRSTSRARPGRRDRVEALRLDALAPRGASDTHRSDAGGEDRPKTQLFEHPFCVLVGDGGFEEVSDEGVDQLAQFLAYGGFLFIDDTTGDTGKAFDQSVRRLTRRLFPTRPLSPLPVDHSVNRAFFLLDRWPGRIDVHPFIEGVTVGNLAPLVYCRNDVSGALWKGEDGRHKFACVPGGEFQRREAVKVGINMMMYSLTANYKNDQAHVRQLMLERRLK